jgi:serine/threonine protein kinase
MSSETRNDQEPARSGTDPDGLDRMLADCLERVETEGEGAIEAFCRDHPDHAGALRRRVAFLKDAGVFAPDGTPEGGSFPERLGLFRLLERLGQGGMGVVYRALQEPPGRQVALKLPA